MLFRVLLMMSVLAPVYGHAQDTIKLSVHIQVPSGFQKAGTIPGYVLTQKNTSIIILESKQPLSVMVNKIYNLSSQNLSVIEKKLVDLDGQQALLVKASHRIKDMDFLKWMLFMGNEQKSVLVDASFPAELESELSDTLKEAVLSAKWEVNPI